jgi:hypothetical protein
MPKKKIHEQQGSLTEGFPEMEPDFPDSPAETPAAGAVVEVNTRALHLHRVLGHLAYLSQTANYETIDVNPWFQSRISRQHPYDYQQHVDERLEIRGRRKEAAETDFGKAFGIDTLIESGGMSPEEAEQMAKDFYNGTNHSGFNPNRQNFQGNYADKKNNKRLNAFRKVLEKQNPELKK